MTKQLNPIQAPIAMIRNLRAHAPKRLSYWGMAINFPQAIGGIIFINHPLGFWIFVCWLLSMYFVGQIYILRGISPWLSLCHAPWLTLFPFLLFGLSSPETSAYFIWLVYVTLTISASLIMDFQAIVLALKGDMPAVYAHKNSQANP